MSAAEKQIFLNSSQSPDEISPESSSDSGPIRISMISEIEELFFEQGLKLEDTTPIFDLHENRITTSISVKSDCCPVDEIPLFTIPDDGTPIKIHLKSFFIRNRNDKCGTKYGHYFTDSTGKKHFCCEKQNERLGGSSCLGLIGRPYIEARMICSDDGTRQIHIIFDLELENLSKTANFTDTIKGYEGFRREIYVKIHDSTCGLPQFSLVSFLPTLFDTPDEIGRICVWISYDIELPNSSVIAECSHVAFDVNYMCCVSGISTFPIPRGIIYPEDEYFPIPRNLWDES
jgi:hypothetical protein